MSSVWLESPKVNSVPYRLFITKGKPRVVAAILIGDDKQFYLAYSREVRGVIRELVLSSPFIDASKSRYLVFRCGKRRVKAKGYLVTAKSKYELDLLTEEVRYLISSTIDVPVRVRKLKSGEEISKISKTLTKEEKRIYELAPIDLPLELEEEIEEEEETKEEQTLAQQQ